MGDCKQIVCCSYFWDHRPRMHCAAAIRPKLCITVLKRAAIRDHRSKKGQGSWITGIKRAGIRDLKSKKSRYQRSHV